MNLWQSIHPNPAATAAEPKEIPTPMSTPPVPITTVTVTPALPSSPTPPAPAASAKPQDFLEKLGQWFKEKFIPVAKVVEKDVTIVAEVAEPVIDVAVPAIAGIYHSTLQTVIALEAVGGTGTGVQKMASAVAQLAPVIIPYLTQLGVKDPTTSMVQAYIQSVVAGLKLLQVQTAAPAAPAA